MDAKLTKRGLTFGGIGAVLQAAGYSWAVWRTTPHLSVLEFSKYPAGAIAISIAGSIMVIVGLALYAQAKGHTRWWALMGCFGLYSVLGFYVLALRSDRREVERAAGVNRPVMTGDRVWLCALAAVPVAVMLPAFGVMISLVVLVAGVVAYSKADAAPGHGGKRAAVFWIAVGVFCLVLQVGITLTLLALFIGEFPDQN